MINGGLTKFLPLGVFLALLLIAPLRAQSAANAPISSTTTTKRVPSQRVSRASDEDVKAISDLVHAGNYSAAQQLNTALLATYPRDQRLIQAKALLEKLVLARSANPGAATGQLEDSAGSPQQAPGTSPDQLTGMDRIDYNALIQRARDAQQATDLAQQKALLNQFMTDSSAYLEKHPDQMLIWQLRAASAISLDNPDAGYEAGQKLIAAGGADSNDQNLHQLLVQLKNKGWLDRQSVELAIAKKNQPAPDIQNALEVFKHVEGTYCPFIFACIKGYDISGIDLTDDGQSIVMIHKDGTRGDTLPVRSLSPKDASALGQGILQLTSDISPRLTTSEAEVKKLVQAINVIKQTPPLEPQARER